MEETVIQGLSQFPQEGFVFRSIVIRKMELLILATLNWKTNLVTPYNYLHYFVAKFPHNHHQSNIAARSSECLLDIVKFVIAASAVLAALDCKMTKEEIEIKLDSITWWISTENESVFSCYLKMKESRQDAGICGYFRNPTGGFVGFLDSKCGTKRRLLFDDSDQTSSSLQEKRLFG